MSKNMTIRGRAYGRSAAQIPAVTQLRRRLLSSRRLGGDHIAGSEWMAERRRRQAEAAARAARRRRGAKVLNGQNRRSGCWPHYKAGQLGQLKGRRR